jgi:general secretion pathway protein L
MANGIKPPETGFAALRRGVRRFFDWWLGELAALVPAPIRRWWRGSGDAVLVSIRDARAVFGRATRDGMVEIATANLDDPALAMQASTLRQRVARAVGPDAPFLLVLPEDQVLLRTLTLPAALAENLRQTLRFELDRYTPFRADQACFDYLIQPQSGQSGAIGGASLQVELAVAARQAVEQHLARVAPLGLNIRGAVLARDFTAPGGRYRNLLPDASVAQVPSVRSKQRLAFAGLSALLMLALLAIPIWQKRATAIHLLAPLAEAKQAARETDALRDRLGKLVDEFNLLPDKKWNGHSLVRVLEDLTKRLPDDTFVAQFDYDGKTVQVLGESASSSALIESLEASPLFKEVGFKTSLVKIQGTNADRFHLTAVLEAPDKSFKETAVPAATENAAAVAGPPPPMAGAVPAEKPGVRQ